MVADFGFDRDLDGSSFDLERDLRSFGFQDGSPEFLDELRTRLGLGFRFWVAGLGFWVSIFFFFGLRVQRLSC